MKKLLHKYKHSWVFLYSFIYMIWFSLLEKRIVPETYIHIGLDDYIVFNEWFVIPYFIWFGYIAGVVLFFFFRSTQDFYKTTAFLFFGMTICLIIYTIWPNGQNLRPDLDTLGRDNFLIDLIRGLYQTDTSTNVCPSIHVFNSIGAHIAISKSKCFTGHKWIKAISFLLMISISLSTVYLKQHSAFDGICAIGLSMIMYFLVYKVDYNRLRNKSKEDVTPVQEV